MFYYILRHLHNFSICIIFSNLATCNMDADCALREICDGARKLCVGKFYPSNFERIYFSSTCPGKVYSKYKDMLFNHQEVVDMTSNATLSPAGMVNAQVSLAEHILYDQ